MVNLAPGRIRHSHAVILHVEDNPATRYATGRVLQREGFTVTEATTGEEGLKLLEERPDLVILDVNLPDLSGFEVCRRIKANPATATVPVLHLSASHVTDEAQARGLESGADGYLVQPVDPDVLVATVKALLRLRRAEEEYRSIFENAVEGIFQTTMDGWLVMANPALARMFGYDSPEEMMAVSDIEQHFYADPKQRAEFARLVRDHGSISGFEARGRHIDGSAIWISLNARALHDGGEVVGYEGTVEDVTERRQAEEQLRARANQQAVVSQLGQKALAETDLQVLMDEAVAVVADTLGVEYCKVLELLPDGEKLLLRAGVGWKEGLVGRATVGAGPDSQAGYTLLSDEPVIVEDLGAEERFSGPPLLHEHEVVSGMSTIIRGQERPFGVLGVHTEERRLFTGEDVNFLQAAANVLAAAIERKRAEEELQEQEEIFRSLSSCSPVGIFLTDLQGRCTYTNPRCQEICGFSFEEALGEGWANFVHVEDRESIFEEWSAYTREGREYSEEFRFVNPRNGTRWVHVRSSPMFSDEDELIGHVATVEDITERKRAEEAIAEVREAERHRMARDLHDGVLQDLSYAVQVMKGTKLQAQGTGLEKELQQEVDAIQRATHGLRAAVHDLRLGDEQNRPFPRLVESLVERNRAMAQGCEMELVVGRGVPPKSFGKAGTELLRILQEALTNALHHSGADRIRIAVGTSGGKLWTEVEDDGRGLDQTKTNAGMGLKGMRERARALGGDLQISSKPGESTKVRFELALEQDREEPEEEVRILLVEDHASVRQGMASVFEREPGFRVAGQAGSLSEARKMLDGVDVAVVDLGLPDGYGGELIKGLRAHNPQAQALVFSAIADRTEIARAVESGAAGVLHKSVEMDEVVEAVRRLRAGETLLPLEKVVELLRFAGSRREEEYEARQAIARLTSREKEVLQALAEGLDSKGIAERLHISVKTEANHLTSILNKLGVHSRLQALVFAVRHGVVEIH